MVSARFTHDTTGTPAAAWTGHPGWPGPGRVDLAGLDRVVVVAAHPDDESLGAAGLVSQARRVGMDVDLFVITAGEHSHPRSPTVSSDEMGVRRREESRTAWAELGTTTSPHFLGIEDGAVAEAQSLVTRLLVDHVGDGRRTLLLAPWRHDGHRDHEAAGRAAAAAARRTGAVLLEYPVWFWHWSRPDEAPWAELVALPLAGEDRERKRRAIAAHTSQVAPLSSAPGDERLLGPAFLELFAAATEVFVRRAPLDDALDDLHLENDEPWAVDRRFYEQRKRELTLAVLPRPRFRHALEIGCSTGALAEALTMRCTQVTAVDSSPAAIERATARLDEIDGVRLRRAELPSEWPADWAEPMFDLVVLSEVGYFLSPADLDTLAVRIEASLSPDGVVVLCHWRHEVAGWVLDGPEVHRRLLERIALPQAARYVDRDVEIVVLCGPDQLPDPFS